MNENSWDGLVGMWWCRKVSKSQNCKVDMWWCFEPNRSVELIVGRCASREPMSSSAISKVSTVTSFKHTVQLSRRLTLQLRSDLNSREAAEAAKEPKTRRRELPMTSKYKKFCSLSCKLLPKKLPLFSRKFATFRWYSVYSFLIPVSFIHWILTKHDFLYYLFLYNIPYC